MRFSSVSANGVAMGETQKWSPVHVRAPRKDVQAVGQGLEAETGYNYGYGPRKVFYKT
jgi:hypothetical protein